MDSERLSYICLRYRKCNIKETTKERPTRPLGQLSLSFLRGR